uniref:Uncharacterized protein n=1 Tax=Rhizophora mucronata TaxID=61149 RepID=A0A2P2PXJ4_RHIMU
MLHPPNPTSPGDITIVKRESLPKHAKQTSFIPKASREEIA